MEPSPSTDATTPTPDEVTYEVYAFDLPKLSEDGKSALPTRPASVERFPSLEGAERHFQSLATKYERVQLLKVARTGDKSEPKLLKRFVGGREERAEDIVRR